MAGFGSTILKCSIARPKHCSMERPSTELLLVLIRAFTNIHLSPYWFLFPFTLLSYSMASGFQFWLIVSAAIAVILLLNRIINNILNVNTSHLLILLGPLICILNHLIRELHLGNTNIELLLLLSLAMHYSLKDKHLLSGLLLAFVVLLKPYFIILGLPFLLYRKWAIILNTLAAILFFILGSFLFLGLSEATSLYTEWIISMSEHSGYLTSAHTISALLGTYLGLSLPAVSTYILFVGVSLGLLLLFWNAKLSMNKGFAVILFCSHWLHPKPTHYR